MQTVCLNIGPSQLSAAVRQDVADIAASGLLSSSHRGPVVRAEVSAAVANMHKALGIPDNYEIVFQSSSTACMEVMLRNLVSARSHHFVHGAFSGRSAATAEEIGLAPTVHERPWDQGAAPEEAEIDDLVELITLAHCETSTGQMWPWEAIRALRARHPDPLLAIDVTSTFGALAMDWKLADVWFCSVQKCLGLPAGLGILIAGPRAVERARALGGQRRVAAWQDLLSMIEHRQRGETLETPNVLAIALLARQMARWDLAAIDADTHAKNAALRATVPEHGFFIRDANWRSLTAHTLQVPDPADANARLAKAGFALGAGYGPLRDTCVRFATFPSVSLDQVKQALAALAPVWRD
ncbi:MAG: aminotransferase class V-fold PLP-dependent enzyme [Planctomycetota bacterium]|nr:aminotransferase class V-fold PLP-dependent enzyme [Planctomycetota bacterium]